MPIFNQTYMNTDMWMTSENFVPEIAAISSSGGGGDEFINDQMADVCSLFLCIKQTE